MTVPQTQLLNLLSEGLNETLKDQNKAPETSCLFQESIHVHIYIFRKVSCFAKKFFYECKSILNNYLKCVYTLVQVFCIKHKICTCKHLFLIEK